MGMFDDDDANDHYGDVDEVYDEDDDESGEEEEECATAFPDEDW
jgi:hypothetical protein